MLGRTDSRLRLVTLLLVFGVIATLLGVRLAYWQLGQGPELRRVADTQAQHPDPADEIRRGDITDRNGTVLATTAYRDLLAAYPDLMNSTQRRQTAAGLAAILGLTGQQQSDLLATFGDDDQNKVSYVVVSRELSEVQSDQIRSGLADKSLVQLDL